MFLSLCIEITNCSSPTATGARKKIRKPKLKTMSEMDQGQEKNFEKRYKKKSRDNNSDTSLNDERFSKIEYDTPGIHTFENMDLDDKKSLFDSEYTQTEGFVKTSQETESSETSNTNENKSAQKEKGLLRKFISIFDVWSSSNSEKSDEKAESIKSDETQYYTPEESDETQYHTPEESENSKKSDENIESLKSSETRIWTCEELENKYYRCESEPKFILDRYTDSIQKSDKLSKSTQTEEVLYENKEFIGPSYGYQQQYYAYNEPVMYMQYPYQMPGAYDISQAYQTGRFFAPGYTSPPVPGPLMNTQIQASGSNNRNSNPFNINSNIQSQDDSKSKIDLSKAKRTGKTKICEILVESDIERKNKKNKIVFRKSSSFHEGNFQEYELTFYDVPFSDRIFGDFDPEVFKQVNFMIENSKKKRMFSYNLKCTFLFDTTKNPLEHLRIFVKKHHFLRANSICFQNIAFHKSQASLPKLSRNVLEPSGETDQFVFSKGFLDIIKNYFTFLPTPEHISEKIKFVDLEYQDLYEKIEDARNDCIAILRDLQKVKSLIENSGEQAMKEIKECLQNMGEILKESSFHLPTSCLKDSYTIYIISLYKFLHEELKSYEENIKSFCGEMYKAEANRLTFKIAENLFHWVDR